MKNRSLVLLSGEGTTIPGAEARALFLAYDRASKFESPEPRVLLAESGADPFLVGRRIAFARRVGVFIGAPSDAPPLMRGRRVRFRSFDLGPRESAPDPASYLGDVEATVDLQDPERELTLVRGDRDYLAVTSPADMRQGWSTRRPRGRPFFHPSAIFPKLSRALFNMTMCREGETFLEPFAGTGSIAMEAHLAGARVVATDISGAMARGALSNMKHFSQDWLGVVRADAARLPIRRVEAVATDIPYGRGSSTRGRAPEELMRLFLPSAAGVMARGSRLVLMHPQTSPVERTDDFSVEEEHHLHVHKLLTRTITILKRR